MVANPLLGLTPFYVIFAMNTWKERMVDFLKYHRSRLEKPTLKGDISLAITLAAMTVLSDTGMSNV
jgi:hypothetical protein